MKSRVLTTTSYAVLSQLALRRWATYELAKHMRRNLRYFWPRAESRIYAEVKALRAGGLVSTQKTRNGRRQRTIYSITPKGRQALEKWLASSPGAGPVLEFEGLLRVLVAPLGTKEDLLRTLRHTRVDIQHLLDTATEVADEYLEGDAPFQQHVHARGFVFDFIYRYAHLVRGWADRVIAEVEQWPDVVPEGKAQHGLHLIEAVLRELPPPPRVEPGPAAPRRTKRRRIAADG